ncbi:hypothetical protein KY363_07770 [Candidatus Woesearchaeota archaeon]|nr:hypothetical protein [Candidatus Woesearchaeota archaeon]
MRYAFPCARVLVDFRKTLSEEEYADMQDAVEHDRPMDRKFLEQKFTKAMEGLRRISDNVWDVDVIYEYFCVRHEDNLSKDLPEIINKLCVVKPGKLVKRLEKDGKTFFRADLGDGDVRIVIPLYKEAAEGDTAMIHYGYAVEKAHTE